jgi:hypothetical protein
MGIIEQVVSKSFNERLGGSGLLRSQLIVSDIRRYGYGQDRNQSDDPLQRCDEGAPQP